MDPDDYYVDVLDAADAWYDLVEQDDEPSTSEWDAAHEKLDLSVEALASFESIAGKSRRQEAWGGMQGATFAVITAAEDWCEVFADEGASEAETNAVIERLGDAVVALRAAGAV